MKVYVSSISLRHANTGARLSPELPPEVQSLFRGEQEMAAVVYRTGLATAKDVETQLSFAVTNAAVRSTLNRLVRKGILLQHQCGRGGTFIYAPALTEPFAREILLRQFADDFYGGSLPLLANELGDLFARGSGVAELLDDYDRAMPPELRDLSPRMRQIADIVYRNGSARILDIQSRLSQPLSTSCIRTLMNRLSARGTVRKRPSGRHREVVYLPGVVTRQVRRLALGHLIDERFEGSAGAALQVALQLVRQESPRTQ